MSAATTSGRSVSRRRQFWRDRRGASAVEFAIVAFPFLILILAILQVGIYYMTQASLDAGVIRTADSLRNNFTATGVPVMPGASTLKGNVASNSGGLIANGSTLLVEIRPLSSLSGATVPITDGTNDYGTTTSALVLRAQSAVTMFAPGFSSIAQATSSAVIRRQGR